MDNLKKKYGLTTGIAMVVGIVIGSGVFFKADNVLQNTGGKLSLSLLAWLIGGLIMVISAYCFSLMATRVEKINGVVDYVEKSSNKKMGYTIAWYLTTIYYPIILSILAFLSVNYFCILVGLESSGPLFWISVALLVVASFAMNTFAPKVAGYFQVSTTVIKLIPIVFVAVVCSIIGLANGNGATAFESIGSIDGVKNDFSSAILATIFAYEGWIIATSINAELRDSKKNLPLALVIGTIIVVVAYILYYLGISLLMPDTNELISSGDAAPIKVVTDVLGSAGGAIFNALVVISCLGTLNGLTMGSCRGMYSVACRDHGPNYEKYKKLNSKSNTSIRSCIFGLCVSLLFVFLWYAAMQGWPFFKYLGSMDETCIALLYTSYILIFIWLIKNGTELNWFQRYLMPVLGILGSLLLAFASTGLFQLALIGDTDRILQFLVFAVLIVVSLSFAFLFWNISDKKNKESGKEITEDENNTLETNE